MWLLNLFPFFKPEWMFIKPKGKQLLGQAQNEGSSRDLILRSLGMHQWSTGEGIELGWKGTGVSLTNSNDNVMMQGLM